MRLFTAQLPTHEKSLEHAAAYALLTHAVEVIYHMPLPDIARDSHGKPYFPAHPEICFNLSHCRGLAACGISDAVLGVDCEFIRPLRPGVLHRSFSPDESRFVLESPVPDESFFRLWTLKESLLKASGRGLTLPLREVNVLPLLRGQSVQTPDGAFFGSTQQFDGYCLAVCTRTPGAPTAPQRLTSADILRACGFSRQTTESL